jgi:hypothetical protein
MPRIVSSVLRATGQREPRSYSTQRLVVPSRPIRFLRDVDALDAIIVRLFAPSDLVASTGPPVLRLVRIDEPAHVVRVLDAALRPFIDAMAHMLLLDFGGVS